MKNSEVEMTTETHRFVRMTSLQIHLINYFQMTYLYNSINLKRLTPISQADYKN